jgi:hypothetical protein
MQLLQHTSQDKWSTWNIRLKTNETLETCIWNTWKKNTWKTLENHWKHTQHPDKTLTTYVWNICNIQINKLATYVEKHRWNIGNSHLQHTCTTIATYATSSIYLSKQAFQEYQNLQDYIQTIQVHHGTKDSWRYIWGSNIYTSSKFYNFPYRNSQPSAPFIWIWDSKCSNELRVFSWLPLMDRLNTRNILKRKKHKPEGNNYNCVLYNSNVEETAFHLFFSCTFERSWWLEGGWIAY